MQRSYDVSKEKMAYCSSLQKELKQIAIFHAMEHYGEVDRQHPGKRLLSIEDAIKELEAYIKRFALDANILHFSRYSLHLKEQKLFYQEELVKKLRKFEFKLLQLLVSYKIQP